MADSNFSKMKNNGYKTRVLPEPTVRTGCSYYKTTDQKPAIKDQLSGRVGVSKMNGFSVNYSQPGKDPMKGMKAGVSKLSTTKRTVKMVPEKAISFYAKGPKTLDGRSLYCGKRK